MTDDEVKDSLKVNLGREDFEWLFSEWAKKRNMFLLLFGMDGLLCVGALTLVSQLFTANLTRHIMEPLNALKDGAQRVRDNMELPLATAGIDAVCNPCYHVGRTQK